MDDLPAKPDERADRKSAKRLERKRQIADSAIEALKELGYANTSLRDIAEKSDVSLGMLHYYFADKTDLIIHCVAIYKEFFVENIIRALDAAEGRQAVIDNFSNALVVSIIDDEMIHRLWYDIRTQAMFDDAFRPAVAAIEAKLIDIVRQAFDRAGHPEPDNVELYYALLDGAFRYLMQGQIGADRKTRDELLQTFRILLAQFL
ncbi:TetR/AcrR family transcriptional regulator [Ruegeria aquimaris]|uniref:TetR/AcrR family transcriptional regulator n=1 Tax=Ruegeria aquimaris TaxID=2984333 RepID=A0ABT3AQI3_9RHOB|nr:TetR/AcrR family transcriptional regulator [Ruegeria sp. XHP0148]MCV2890955.1 TetR/AcrR family transcriptional regulator [Ruegeria sp. XHP0148]